jgi:hypothetical protein
MKKIRGGVVNASGLSLKEVRGTVGKMKIVRNAAQ